MKLIKKALAKITNMLNKRALAQKHRRPETAIQPPPIRRVLVRPHPSKHKAKSARRPHRRAQIQPARMMTAAAPQTHARPSAPAKTQRRWLWYAIVGVPLAGIAGVVLLVVLSVLLLWAGGRVLPGVSVAGIPVGGMTAESAAAALLETWNGRGVILRDGTAVYPVAADVLGITLDGYGSAESAMSYGRADGGLAGFMRAVLSQADVAPVASFDASTFAAGLAEVAPHIEVLPRNAGVQFVNGEVQPRAAVDGRLIDIAATLRQFEQEGAVDLADGVIDLVMYTVAPEVTDAATVVAAARALLANALEIRVYNPVTNQDIYWTILPEEWGTWLTAAPASERPTGFGLAVDTGVVRAYLETQASSLPTTTYLDFDEATQAVQDSVVSGRAEVAIRAFNRDRQYLVQAGETITSIAWDYGVPYLYIERANSGLSDGLSVGQTITIPSADTFLEFPVVPDKRIVVNISEQRVRVYENGGLKWDWVASTGINSSPTWPGIYQIISHEPNAYAANWDLWMPDFMGVYRPIPGADFTNGFHGFPTRGGSQLLWTNSLGTRVTYGCILISDDHIRQLYDWAEEGVIVEIRP